MTVLGNIPFELTLDEFRDQLNLGNNIEKAKKCLDNALPLIDPKAMYRVAYIDDRADNVVTMEGIQFTGALLSKKLEDVERVFPFIVTIGSHLETAIRKSKDILDQFYLDTIGNMALIRVRKYLKQYLLSTFGLEKMSSMSPGALAGWPLEEQGPLFSILDNVETAVGVSLTEHFLMIPGKSVSGIFFPTEIPFYSCQLCPRKRCPSRKAAFDRKQAAELNRL